MKANFKSGSVRGVRSNSHPYRDRRGRRRQLGEHDCGPRLRMTTTWKSCSRRCRGRRGKVRVASRRDIGGARSLACPLERRGRSFASLRMTGFLKPARTKSRRGGKESQPLRMTVQWKSQQPRVTGEGKMLRFLSAGVKKPRASWLSSRPSRATTRAARASPAPFRWSLRDQAGSLHETPGFRPA
jgi:hypothetical protein